MFNISQNILLRVMKLCLLVNQTFKLPHITNLFLTPIDACTSRREDCDRTSYTHSLPNSKDDR